MAWLDDRFWCHPKFVGLSDSAVAAYCRGLAYSHGMATGGHLNEAQQRLLGGTPKVSRELADAGLWNPNGDGVLIHDWEDHNGDDDARRQRERERLREYRRRRKGSE